MSANLSEGDATRQRQYLEQQNPNIDPTLRNILDNPFNAGNASSSDLLSRYGAVYGAGNNDITQLIQNTYGDQDRLGQTAYNEMASQLGRAPTTQEWNQLYQAFQGPNGIINGRAAVSQYYQQLQKDPSNPLSPLNPQNANYQKTLSPYTSAVNGQFQQLLGRQATPDELNHFASLLASGQTDAYGLGSFLKTMPEYTNAQDTQFRNSLNDQLSTYDQNEFKREQGDVMSSYAARGFQPGGNSPSLDYALTDLMGKIANNRSAYLAQLSASQYGGNKDLAASNYQNSLNQIYQQNQQNRQNNLDMSNYYTQRGNQGADYYTQMNDYRNFLNQNRNQQNGFGGAVGAGIAGAGALAPLGPWGAAAGAGAGLFSYFNR